MMKRISVSFAAGSFLVFLSSLVLIGWITANPRLVSIAPGQINQVFNAALCFLLAGLTLCVPDNFSKIQQSCRFVVGLAIMALTTLTLSQHVLHIDLGIDQWVVQAGLDRFNPNLGRMGGNTAILLWMVGAVLAGWSYRSHTSMLVFTRATLLILFLVGVFTLVGYWLKLEFLYYSPLFLRTSLYTAIDFILLSIGLWAAALRDNPVSFFDAQHDDKKILLVSASILLVVALIGVLSGFSVFFKKSEEILKNTLHQSLISRINLFNDNVYAAIKEVNSVAENPRFQRLLPHYSSELNGDFDLLFSSSGYSAVNVFNNDGGLLYRYGNFSQLKNVMTSLQLPGMQTASLIWEKGWMLQVNKTLYYQNQKVGSMLVELPLKNLNQLYSSAVNNNRDGKLTICTLQTAGEALCTPQSLSASLIRQSLVVNDNETSMALALQGKAGNFESVDKDNHTVFTAFSPISGLKLGAVVQIDTVDLYGPIRMQLDVIGPIFLLSIGIGLLLLSWQVSPLVRKILISEKQALNSNALLRESEGRFRSAFDSAAVGMSLVSLDGRWLRVNQSLCDILGYSESELLSMNSYDLTYLDDLDDEKKKLRQLIQGDIHHIRLEKRYITSDGYILWVLVTSSLVRDVNNVPLYFISQVQNINIQKHAEERLKELAYHDPLTGLDNRSEIEKNIESALFSSRVTHNGFALIFLDLDHFKEINDNYGHDVGDALLKEVANRLKASVRRADRVGRLGGDEFVIILTDLCDFNRVSAIARQVLDVLSEPIILNNVSFNVTTSIGISVYPDDGLSMETLMKHADVALYCAKEFGKNTFQFFCGMNIRP